MSRPPPNPPPFPSAPLSPPPPPPPAGGLRQAPPRRRIGRGGADRGRPRARREAAGGASPGGVAPLYAQNAPSAHLHSRPPVHFNTKAAGASDYGCCSPRRCPRRGPLAPLQPSNT